MEDRGCVDLAVIGTSLLILLLAAVALRAGRSVAVQEATGTVGGAWAPAGVGDLPSDVETRAHYLSCSPRGYDVLAGGGSRLGGHGPPAGVDRARPARRPD
jgi:hypothetical protein